MTNLRSYAVWKKLSRDAIKKRISEALASNINFDEHVLLGIPASSLDPNVFYSDFPGLTDAPFLSSMIKNPNHIGCHTMGESESFFRGTQEIERELIDLCAVDILNGKLGAHDGYVASGGTEANMQAIWIYRNYFIEEHKANIQDIVILCSEDSHYSMFKASNIMQVDYATVAVNPDNRKIEESSLNQTLDRLQSEGKKYFIVVANMMTTMFGSVDNPDLYSDALKARNLDFKMHIDGAYGGFLYPFTDKNNRLCFANENVSSVTLDAHKLAQAPYGTGIFVARKGLMPYVYTKKAEYVQGLDATMIGSRSGANAVAVWMILMTYGPFGWHEKNAILQMRTSWLCEKLDLLKIGYFRNPYANIVTIKSDCISKEIAEKYHLVPDSHGDHAKWYKIVVMEHVTVDALSEFVRELD